MKWPWFRRRVSGWQYDLCQCGHMCDHHEAHIARCQHRSTCRCEIFTLKYRATDYPNGLDPAIINQLREEWKR